MTTNVPAFPAHTPGPWVKVHGAVVEVETRKLIADTRRADNLPREVQDANARLIAAAPELLAMAKQYASECGECNGTGRDVTITESGEYGLDVDCEACADIRALITKAEGGQPIHWAALGRMHTTPYALCGADGQLSRDKSTVTCEQCLAKAEGQS